MKEIVYKNCDSAYLKEAVELALIEYREECSRNNQLPKEDFYHQLQNLLTELFSQKYGKMAFIDGKMIGYLAFYGPFGGHFGNVKGVFSPFGGNAFCKTANNGLNESDRGKLVSLLFEEVSKEMLKDEIVSYAICRPAGDATVMQSLVMTGFGVRCSDSIVRLSERGSRCELSPEFTFCELADQDKPMVRSLAEKLRLHLCDSPIFFPPLIEQLDEWLTDEDIRVFAAKKGNQAVGFISITNEGETYITYNKEITNICGAYVEPSLRQTGLAKQLLEYVCQTCEKEGYVYLGVDCETLNPTALRFWGKYFQNYTYSFHRRIDERCLGYLDYLKNEIWKHDVY